MIGAAAARLRARHHPLELSLQLITISRLGRGLGGLDRRRARLQAEGLRFDVRVRPNFEDAHFTALHLAARGARVACLDLRLDGRPEALTGVVADVAAGGVIRGAPDLLRRLEQLEQLKADPNFLGGMLKKGE